MIATLLCFTLAWAGLPSAVDSAAKATSPRAAAQLLEEAQASATQEELGWLLLYAGEYRRLAGDQRQARELFSRVAADLPTHGAREPSKVGLAVLNAEGVAGGNTLATLELITENGVPPSLNAERWLLVAVAHISSRNESKAKEALRKAEAAGSPDKLRVTAKIEELRRALSPAAKPTAKSPGGGNAPVSTAPGDLGAITAIREDLAASRFAEVSTAAASFATQYPDSPFLREAAYAGQRASRSVATQRDLVAVVLPLTGEYAQPAAQIRDAIKLSNEVRGGVRLEVLDSLGTADGCSKAVEKAVIELGAAVVLGPLTKDESLGCAPTAQALHVPMLTFTSAEEVLGVGDQIFRAYPSVAEQVSALLDELMTSRGWKRFSILHPRNAFGEGAARTFQALVEARGGSIAKVGSYDAGAKDFRSAARSLGKPVDFDAVFVPDGYQRSALLASALAFEEYAVGSFRPHYGDRPLGLVGLNAWNNSEWPRRGGDYVRESVFVDAFWVQNEAPHVQQFVDRWKDRGQGAPTVVEAAAWDALAAATVALATPGDPATNLLALDMQDGVSGLHGFNPERTARRSWTILTVRGDSVAAVAGPGSALDEQR